MLNKLNYVVLLYCCIEVVISERNKFNKLLFVFLDKKTGNLLCCLFLFIEFVGNQII